MGLFGSSGPDPVKEQAKLEAERQARIAQSVDAINRMFKYGTNAEQAGQVQSQIAQLQAAEQPHTVTQHIQLPSQTALVQDQGLVHVPVQSYKLGQDINYQAVGRQLGLGAMPGRPGGQDSYIGQVNQMLGVQTNPRTGATQALPQYRDVTHTIPGIDNSAKIDPLNARLADYAAAAQKPYDTYAQNIQDQLMQDLDRQRAEANRQVGFNLARHGLTGGSADVDAGSTLLHDYNQGVLSAQQKAQQARAGFVNSDQQSKQQLISLAQAGLNTGQAQQQALQAINANIANAKAQATQATLGDVFNGLGQAQLANQIQQGRQTAQQQFQSRYGNIYHHPSFGQNS